MKTWQWVLVIAGALLVLAQTGPGSAVIAGILSIPQIVRVARNAGFSGTDLVIAVAVALAESGGDSAAKGDIDIPHPGSASYGLWQINSYYHPEYGPDFSTLFDPQANANAAFAIYQTAGNHFSPWSTYNSGSYSAFMSAVEAVVNA